MMFLKRKSLELIPMPLPMTLPEFNEWSDRIIKQASLPTKNMDTQRFALASMILQTPPHEFMRPDAYYVYLLKKAASDQCAMQVIDDLKAAKQKQSQPASEAPTNPEITNGKGQT